MIRARQRCGRPPLIRGALALALLALSGPAGAVEVVRASGTGTALGLLERLGTAFARAHPGSRVQVLPNLGSTGAVEAVARGALDVAVSGRPLVDAERAKGLLSFEIARTPFVFAVGPNAGVRAVTTGELVRMLRGELLTWPTGERVRVVLRPATDADVAVLRGHSAELSAAVDAALARPGMLIAVTNQECNDTIQRTPGAIGGTTLMQLLAEPRDLSVLAWDGEAPTVEAMRAGRYPLAKPLYVVIRREPGAPVRRWLSFLSTPTGRRVVEQLGAAPTPFVLP